MNIYSLSLSIYLSISSLHVQGLVSSSVSCRASSVFSSRGSFAFTEPSEMASIQGLGVWRRPATVPQNGTRGPRTARKTLREAFPPTPNP